MYAKIRDMPSLYLCLAYAIALPRVSDNLARVKHRKCKSLMKAPLPRVSLRRAFIPPSIYAYRISLALPLFTFPTQVFHIASVDKYVDNSSSRMKRMLITMWISLAMVIGSKLDIKTVLKFFNLHKRGSRCIKLNVSC